MKLTVVNIRMLKTQQSHFSSSSSSSNSSNNNNSNSINQAFSSSFRRTLSTRPYTRITARPKRGNWSQLLLKLKLFSTLLAKQSNRQSHKYQKHRLKLSPRSPVNHTEPRSSTRSLPGLRPPTQNPGHRSVTHLVTNPGQNLCYLRYQAILTQQHLN